MYTLNVRTCTLKKEFPKYVATYVLHVALSDVFHVLPLCSVNVYKNRKHKYFRDALTYMLHLKK